jgi:DNA (cytosine-5)-methyltransferase 1
MTHGSLFSGIGGFELAAEWSGFTNVFLCEIEPFNQRVLKHYWPNSELHTDVKEFPSSDYTGRIDILTGGFPCQPYSTAGKRLGKEDDRHLWPFMLEIIREIAPTYVVGENVRGLVNWSDGLVFEEVCADLEAEGYDVQPFILPAAGVGAPHKRDRVWFVAYSNIEKCDRRSSASEQEWQEAKQGRDGIQRTAARFSQIGDATNANCAGVSRQSANSSTSKETRQGGQGIASAGDFGGFGGWQEFPTQPPVCGGDDGLPTELDGITFSKWRNNSIKAYGNAIVPQVAYQIFQAINEYERAKTGRVEA